MLTFSIRQIRGDKSLLPLTDPNWTANNEYDPLWPNDFHTVVKGEENYPSRSTWLIDNEFAWLDMRDAKRLTADEADAPETKRRRYTESAKEKSRDRFEGGPGGGGGTPASASSTGFGRRPQLEGEYSDEEEDERNRRRGGGDSRRRESRGCKRLRPNR